MKDKLTFAFIWNSLDTDEKERLSIVLRRETTHLALTRIKNYLETYKRVFGVGGCHCKACKLYDRVRKLLIECQPQEELDEQSARATVD